MLALAPLARSGLIADVVIDAKSGVSGAGRAATEATHFVSVDENVNAYGVPRHRHTPEIEQELAVLGAERADHVHSAPAAARPGRARLRVRDCSTAIRAISTSSTRRPTPTSRSSRLPASPAGVRAVRETNLCRISVHRDERTGRVIVFGAIDNLWKGAASQAVQNLNLMFALPEGMGIS